MHTKSLFAMTLLLVGSQSLSACTIVDASDDPAEGEHDAATANEDTTEDETSNDTAATENDASAQSSNDTDEADDADETSTNEDAGTTDSSDDTTHSEGEEDGGSEGEAPEGDGGDTDTTDSEGEDTSPDEGTVYKNGSIGITQSILGAAGFEIVSASATASFAISTFEATPTQPVVELPCETTTVGDCTLRVCELDGDSEPEPEVDSGYSSESVSAGSVKITGVTEDITLTANSDGEYTSAQAQGSRWFSGGETFIASAPGSDAVPAFSIELTAPSALTVTAPELSLTTPVNASRSADFEVVWSDADEGNIALSMTDASETDVDATVRQITCSVPASAGSVVIDASLLSGFGDSAMVNATIADSVTMTVEDWSLAFSVSSTAASGLVELED